MQIFGTIQPTDDDHINRNNNFQSVRFLCLCLKLKQWHSFSLPVYYSFAVQLARPGKRSCSPVEPVESVIPFFLPVRPSTVSVVAFFLTLRKSPKPMPSTWRRSTVVGQLLLTPTLFRFTCFAPFWSLTCLSLLSWTILTTWPVTGLYWVHIIWTNLVESGQNMTMKPKDELNTWTWSLYWDVFNRRLVLVAYVHIEWHVKDWSRWTCHYSQMVQ